MDHIINILPDSIANQIAAGEVIQRPASVIKELVENAIDAEATEIIIEIKEAGRTLIQVIDNGKGMAPTDARMAFERHATSKIKKAEDLFALSTMGFRGEALASIAAVAQVSLQTRTEENEIGTKVEIEASKVTSTEPVACARGANFAIKNLFFNIPARRKFLKSNETEFKHIITEIQHIATVHPDATFTLRHNGQLTFSLAPTTLKQRIIDIYGKRLNNILLPLEAKTPLISVSGYISRSSATRKRSAQQYFYVNERYMRHPRFSKTILNAYEGMIQPGEQPEFFIFLTVDPAAIDVNIHPTKTEIKFEAENDIAKLLYAITREALMKGASIPTLDFEKDIDIPVFKPLSTDEMIEPSIIDQPRQEHYTTRSSTLSLSSETEGLPKEYEIPEISDWDEFYKEFENNNRSENQSLTTNRNCIIKSSKLSPLPLEEAHQEPLKEENRQRVALDKDKLLITEEYIILPQAKEIHLIHILRAKTRITYQNYLSMVSNNAMISRRLLFPELIDLGINETMKLEKHIETLRRTGFDISPMGGSTYAINALPDGIASGYEEQLLLDLLEECSNKEVSSDAILYDRIAMTLTRQRIKSEPTQINKEEALSLLSALYMLSEKEITPDGKLIISILSERELIKRFT